VVEYAVTYACDPSSSGGTGILRRYWNYAIVEPQPTPSGGSNAVLARNISDCSFTYAASSASARTSILALTLWITQDGETVRLFQQAHINNVP
jgi:MSHA biogenesis protein MshO